AAAHAAVVQGAEGGRPRADEGEDEDRRRALQGRQGHEEARRQKEARQGGRSEPEGGQAAEGRREGQPDRRQVASAASGVSSANLPRTASACSSASAPGGKCAFGIASTHMPAALAGRMPLCESSTAAAFAGSTSSRRAASR